MPPTEPAASPFSGAPPPPGAPPHFGTPAPGAPAAPAPDGEATRPAQVVMDRPCPQCSAMVPAGFKFCGSCGGKLEDLAPAAEPAAPMPAPERPPAGRMVLIRPDGSEGGAYALSHGTNVIGRETDSLFENDFYLSPRHLEITIQDGQVHLVDCGSLNGVFFKIREERPLEDGQIFRIGQELLRFDVIDPPRPLPDGTEIMGSPNNGIWGRVVVVAGDGVDGNGHLLRGDSIMIGRESGDIQFPEDGYVSGSHLRITDHGGRFTLADLGSSNGTFIRIGAEETVPPGTFVLVGQQLFRVEVG